MSEKPSKLAQLAKLPQAELDRARAKAPRRAAPRMRIHYLVPAPEGTLASGAADSDLPLPAAMREDMPARFAAACDATLVIDGEIERGTGEVWAVRCDECKATEVFQANDRPRPGLRLTQEQRRATGKKDCGGCK